MPEPAKNGDPPAPDPAKNGDRRVLVLVASLLGNLLLLTQLFVMRPEYAAQLKSINDRLGELPGMNQRLATIEGRLSIVLPVAGKAGR